MAEIIPLILVALGIPISIWLLVPHAERLSPSLYRDIQSLRQGDWRSVMAAYRHSMAYGRDVDDTRDMTPATRNDTTTSPDVATRHDDTTPAISWRALCHLPLLFVYGGMGSGKTTLVRSLVSVVVAEGGRCVIVSPKCDRGTWWSLPVATIGRDLSYTDIIDTLSRVIEEVRQRQALAQDGVIRDRLIIIIDDIPMIARHAGDTLASLIEAAAIIGRSLNVQLVVISQSTRAQRTGFAGMHDVLMDAPRVAMRNKAGVLIDGDTTSPLDTNGITQVAGVPNDRYWIGTAPAPAGTTTDTAPGTGTGTGTDAHNAPSVPVPDDVLIAELVRRGVSANQIHAIIGGNRAAVLAKVKVAGGEPCGE